MGATFYKTELDQHAFGIVPAYRKYELYYARFHELRAPVAELLAERGALRICDVGAGTGDARRFLQPLGGEQTWVAVEGNPERARLCRELGYQQVETAVDLEKAPLPFADGSFEVVIASHVLEHLETAEQALADWYRVLRPGGLLLIGVPMHLGVVAALARLKYRLFGRRPRGHCHFFSMRSLRRLLAPYPTQRIWGFRVLSARRQLPLEDWEGFYRWSLWMGARFPGLTAEVNVVIRKPAEAQSSRKV